MLKQWNKNAFGDIIGRKRDIHRRLRGIEKTLVQGPNDFLTRLQKELWSELEDILFQEETLWFQKSRSKWLQFGDKKSRYFHFNTIVHHQKNLVDRLMDRNGD